jgi:hypothetical protein
MIGKFLTRINLGLCMDREFFLRYELSGESTGNIIKKLNPREIVLRVLD